MARKSRIKYNDRAHQRRRAQKRYERARKAFESRLKPGQKNPYSVSTKGKSTAMINKQARQMERYRFIQVDKGNFYRASDIQNLKRALTNAMTGARNFAEFNSLTPDAWGLYRSALSRLDKMSLSEFASFYDWLKANNLMRLITPSTYGYWDKNNVFTPNDPEVSATAINDFILMLTKFRKEKAPSKSQLKGLYSGGKKKS